VTDLMAGILLPASVFSSAWFQTLAVFVALNTLVYVGLTLAKLIRWPAQLSADDVPRLIARPDDLDALERPPAD
jgi:hypothetical protein